MNTTKFHDVVVIGAGIAGVAAASSLAAKGHSVLVLEARSRPGGRIHSVKTDQGQTIDLGAQLIGDCQTRISALVDQFRLTRVPLYDQGWTFHQDNERKTNSYKKGSSLPLSLFGYIDAAQMLWRTGRKLASFRQEMNRLDIMNARDFIEGLGFTSEAVRAVSSHAEAEMCLPLEDVSAYEFLHQLHCVGGVQGESKSAQWFLAEGMGAVVDGLAQHIQSQMVFSSPVSGITRVSGGYLIECGDLNYRSNRVLVTAPPQLYGQIGLTNLLPNERLGVIDGYRVGSVIKTILVFDRPWWRALQASGRGFSRGGLFGSMIDASPTNGRYGILVLFSTALDFSRLQHFSRPADRCEQALRWIAEISGQKIPEPIAGFSTNWNSDPWSCGGYASRRAIGGWLASAELFSPYEGIHFAGTETADQWRGFAEGALQSAERAVNELLWRGE
jgi:monoamine oxidase